MTILFKRLAGIGAIIVTIYLATIAGMYELMKYLNEREVKYLESQISSLQDAQSELQTKFADTKNLAEKCEKNIVSENLDENDISERLAHMQKERDILINKALSQATNSIDPRSEIATHIALLQSESEDNQDTALNFLFEIRDPVTFKALQDYFTNSDSWNIATNHHTTFEWYDLFLELELVAGTEFLVNELDNQNSYRSNVAYKTLDRAVGTNLIAQEAKPNLEALALISDNASARGYAKLLLEKISDIDHETQ